MAPHSSTFAWKIPWTEEPGGLQSMGSLESDTTERLHFHFSLSCTGEGNGNPLQCSCLENPRDGGAWWAAVYGVAQSRTRLKRLSSSSNRGGQRSPKSDRIRNSEGAVTVSLTVTCLSYFTPCGMYFFMFYSFQVSGPKGNSIYIYWLCWVFVAGLSLSLVEASRLSCSEACGILGL